MDLKEAVETILPSDRPTDKPKQRSQMASAVDLVDKPIICPECGKEAALRKDDRGYWVDCQERHRPAVGITAETALRAIQPEGITISGSGGTVPGAD